MVASVSQIPASEKGLIRIERGVLSILPGSSPALRRLGEYAVLASVCALSLYPTIASLAPRRLSLLYMALCLLLLLPALTRVVLAPFVSIMLASAMLMILNRSPGPLVFGLAGYAFFYMAVYRTRMFYTAYLGVSLVAALVALLQFLLPLDALNFHATADSVNSFLDQYRPTSIFPSQAYYNQLLLGLLPLFYLVGERRAWVYLVIGATAAVTGSTAGLALAILAVFVVPERGYLALAGFAAMIAVQAVAFKDRLIYNFGFEDVLLSVGSRLVMPSIGGQFTDAPAPDAPAGLAPGFPTLEIAVDTLALFGLLALTMLVCRARLPLSFLVPYCAALGAVFVGQMIHPVAGSMYFSLSLALMAALAWTFIKLTQGAFVPGARRSSALSAGQ